MADLMKKLLPYQSEFLHCYACWANNHMGWEKMKRSNRKLAKKQLRREIEKQMRED